jgi:hypothetical protein
MAVGLAAQLGHGTEHALEVLRHLERRATVMGVAHLHDALNEHDGGTFVHAHGGAAHAHDAGVGALLVAAADVEDHGGGAVTAPVELSSHLPAGGMLPVLAAVDRSLASAEPRAAAPSNLLPPPLPPPRA